VKAHFDEIINDFT